LAVGGREREQRGGAAARRNMAQRSVALPPGSLSVN